MGGESLGAVLVVDDEPDILWSIKDALTTMEVPCVCVSTAAEAIEALAADRSIRVLLSDLRMPDHDGHWLISKVAEMCSAEKRALAFILMADRPVPLDGALSGGLCDAGILPKPFRIRDLREALGRSHALLRAMSESEA